MQIVLEIEGKEKAFIANVKARSIRNAMDLKERINFMNLKAADMDEVVNFVVDVYGNRFTVDQLYDGLNADDLIPKITETIEKVINGVTSRLDTFPQN